MSAPTWLLDRIRQEHVPPATPAENLCIGTPEHCQAGADRELARWPSC
jgi:hypothetical protein